MKPTDLAKELRNMVGYLYALYVAVGRFLEDSSDEAEDELEDKYKTLQELIGGPKFG